VEAREAGFAGQELLHGGLFEVALLCDEPIQPTQQRIHIAQRRRDGASLVVEWRNWDAKGIETLIGDLADRGAQMLVDLTLWDI